MRKINPNIQLNKFINFIIQSQTKEVWKEIPGTDGRYFVSTGGKVLSLCRKARILQPYLPNNYLCVKILGKQRKLHRIVAEVFIDNPENKKFVHHKDGNRLNNAVSNLQWVNHQEHMEIHKKMKKVQDNEK